MCIGAITWSSFMVFHDRSTVEGRKLIIWTQNNESSHVLHVQVTINPMELYEYFLCMPSIDSNTFLTISTVLSPLI